MDQLKLNNGHSDLQIQARTAVWNVSLLLSQRGLFILGNLVFAALIPRLMGPENFGRYTLIISLSIWFGLFSNMGLPTVIL